MDVVLGQGGVHRGFGAQQVGHQRAVAAVGPTTAGIFANLTVDENLTLGAFARPASDKAAIAEDREKALSFFPRVRERLKQNAGTLSGGEQQMLAIARALMAKPRLLMLDEPSLGLAPLLVKEIFAFIAQINEEMGLTVLVVEQNARRALEIAHHGYIMEQGRIVLEGTAAELADNPDVKEFYLGMKADDAEPAIEKLVRQRNLPIAVMSVLLHNRRDLVIRGPKFKKTSLHSLHYLLRQDLASHLKDNIAFSTRMITDIKAAGTAVQKPAGNVLNADLVKQLEGAKAKLQTTESELLGSAELYATVAAHCAARMRARDHVVHPLER